MRRYCEDPSGCVGEEEVMNGVEEAIRSPIDSLPILWSMVNHQGSDLNLRSISMTVLWRVIAQWDRWSVLMDWNQLELMIQEMMMGCLKLVDGGLPVVLVQNLLKVMVKSSLQIKFKLLIQDQISLLTEVLPKLFLQLQPHHHHHHHHPPSLIRLFYFGLIKPLYQLSIEHNSIRARIDLKKVFISITLKYLLD